MRKIPKVGILMPSYNQGQFIAEAIQSLKAQTFQDFEVLIVDDHSSDGVTPNIVQKIKYDKVRAVILEKKNLGINNLTIKHLPRLRSEYLLIFCADDVLKPQFLEKTVAYLDNHPDKAAVATWLEYFGEATGIKQYDPAKCKLPDMLVENHFLGSSLVRRSVMEEFGWSSPDPRCLHQDYHRWVSILEKGHSLGVVEEPLFKYRTLHTSLSHSASAEREKAFREFFMEQHAASIKKHHQFIIRSLWDAQIEKHEDYKNARVGYEWLDKQYKQQLKTIESLKERNAYLERRQQRLIFSVPYKIYDAGKGLLRPAARRKKRSDPSTR